MIKTRACGVRTLIEVAGNGRSLFGQTWSLPYSARGLNTGISVGFASPRCGTVGFP